MCNSFNNIYSFKMGYLVGTKTLILYRVYVRFQACIETTMQVGCDFYIVRTIRYFSAAPLGKLSSSPKFVESKSGI